MQNEKKNTTPWYRVHAAICFFFTIFANIVNYSGIEFHQGSKYLIKLTLKKLEYCCKMCEFCEYSIDNLRSSPSTRNTTSIQTKPNGPTFANFLLLSFNSDYTLFTIHSTHTVVLWMMCNFPLRIKWLDCNIMRLCSTAECTTTTNNNTYIQFR